MATDETTDKTKTPDDPGARPKPSRRALYAAYACGCITNSMNMMLRVAVPLWAVYLDMSPTMIGIAIGATGVLPFFLSIHGGVLMDRFGTRRVNTVLAAMATVAIILYPVLPFASAVIVLQLITGLSTNMGWMGAQGLIVQLAPGDTAVIGRFTMYGRMGLLVSPALTGLMWDLSGPWGTFAFITACSCVAFLTFYLSPAGEVDSTATGEKASLKALTPKLSEYLQAFAMLGVPVIAFISFITFTRIAGAAVQSSFYVVYLEQIDVSGTMIGVLLGIAGGFGMFGAGAAGRIERALKTHWTLILSHALAVIAICITPYLGGIMSLLVLAAMVRGATQGLGQPVMFALLSRSVSREEQGRSIGLRTTVNRIASMCVPPFMGIMAELYGMEASFLITGALILLVCAALAVVAPRMEAFRKRDVLE